MLTPTVALLLLAAAPPGDVAPAPLLPMPPPPAGMRALTDDEKKRLLDATTDDDEAGAPEADEQSAELEELQALEQVALDPAARTSAQVLQAMRRLGLGSPLRRPLEDAVEDDELREDTAPAELPRITDLAHFDVGVVKDEYDIPVEMQPLVSQYIQFFQGAGRRWFRHWMSRSTRFIPVMQPILEAHGMPKDTVYLAMIESGFSTAAFSWAHAVGPWQFIAGTGKRMGLKVDFWVDERRDPIKSTIAASRYLSELHDELGHWYLAWAAYNTGSGRVRRVMRKKGTDDFWELSDGKGLAKETKHYVPKLIACALVAKHPKAFGFGDDEFDFLPPYEFDEVQIVNPTDLEVIARAAGSTVDEIRELNPELKRWCTPPGTDAHPYVLRIPRGRKAQFAEAYARIGPKERLNFALHTVRRGETLSGIAASFHSAPEAILQLNHLRNVRALRVNAELVIPVPSKRAAAEGVADVGLERQVAKARRNGFAAVRPEEEIPAGANRRPVAQGPIQTAVVDGKTRVSYGVQDGDNLWTIAQRFNVSVDELRRWNHLGRRAHGLQVGTLLAIYPGTGAQVESRGGTLVAQKGPANANVVPASATSDALSKKTVKLAAGDTLWSVAQKYGVSVEDLKRWNGIRNHRQIKAGQELTLVTP